jgi:hypothetical protein
MTKLRESHQKMNIVLSNVHILVDNWNGSHQLRQ